MSHVSANLAEHLNRMLSAEALATLGDRELLERFALARDGEAFAAILNRHGALVRSVCRRIVNDPDLADDVFQATFIVLSRKAGGLRQKNLLGNWLFGVAQRLALRALQQQARRLKRERKAASQRPESASNQHPWDELILVLHEELGRLPERLRAPLLACYLEGKTQDEAARFLGWNVKTLRRRLEQGRELLHTRMVRRGATLSAGLFASILAPSAAALPVDDKQALFAATLAGVRGEGLTGQVSELVARGMRMLTISKLRTAFFSALAICGLAVTTGLIWQSTIAKDAPAEEKKEAGPNPPTAAAEAKRDPYGDPLPAGAVVRMGSLRLFHGSYASMVFNPDGKSLFSGGGTAIRQWNAQDGEELMHLLTRNAADRAANEEPGLPGNNIMFTLFTPDAKTAVIATQQSGRNKESEIQVSIWDLAHRKKLRSFPLTKPDGERILLGLWNLEMRALAPDASKLALIEARGDLWVWDLKKDHPVANRVKVEQGHSVLFNPARKQAITTNQQGHSTIWDMDFEKVIGTLGDSEFNVADGPRGWSPRGRQYPIAVSPDGKLIAVSSFVQEAAGAKVVLGIYEMARLEEAGQRAAAGGAPKPAKPVREWSSEGHANITMVCQFAPDNKSVLVIKNEWMSEHAEDIHVWRWDLDQKEPVRWPTPIDTSRSGGPVQMVISPDGKTLATSAGDRRIHLWDIATAKEKAATQGHQSAVTAIALLPDAKTLRSVGDDATLRDWELETGKQLRRMSDRNQPFNNSTLSPDGKWLLTWDHWTNANMGGGGGRGGKGGSGVGGGFGRPEPQETKRNVLIRDAGAGETLHCLSEKPISWVAAFTPDGKTFVTFDGTNNIEFWDLQSGKKKGSISVPARWEGLYQNAEGKQGVVVQSSKLLIFNLFPDSLRRQWDLDKEVFEERLGQQTPDSLTSMAVSPDGKQIALGVLSGVDYSSRLVLCELEGGKKIRDFDTSGHSASLLAFSPDGKTLALGDSKIMLFDVDSGKLQRTLAGHRGSITQMIYSKDGKRLASASNDSTILIWDMAK